MARSMAEPTPLDVALYNGPVNDPFVPNTSYREYTLRRKSGLPNIAAQVKLLVTYLQ